MTEPETPHAFNAGQGPTVVRRYTGKDRGRIGFHGKPKPVKAKVVKRSTRRAKP